MILYNRKKVKYRKDGYCWKKRKDGKTTREDHMKLKVQGVEVKSQGPSWASYILAPGPRGQAPLSKVLLFVSFSPPFLPSSLRSRFTQNWI